MLKLDPIQESLNPEPDPRTGYGSATLDAVQFVETRIFFRKIEKEKVSHNDCILVALYNVPGSQNVPQLVAPRWVQRPRQRFVLVCEYGLQRTFLFANKFA